MMNPKMNRKKLLWIVAGAALALILTVAVVAAVMLTLRRRTGIKSQNPTEQTMVKAADRMRMVKMAAETPVVHTASTPVQSEEGKQ